MISAMTLDKVVEQLEDGGEAVLETVPYVHLAGAKDVLRINETSWTALNDPLFGNAD